MNLRRPRPVLTLASAALVVSTASVAAFAPAARAESRSATAADGAAQTTYFDDRDNVEVCDFVSDHHGAIGWIEVRQANGTFKAFSRVYNGNGARRGCITVHQDVLREASTVKVVSCIVDGPHGRPFNCGQQYASGR